MKKFTLIFTLLVTTVTMAMAQLNQSWVEGGSSWSTIEPIPDGVTAITSAGGYTTALGMATPVTADGSDVVVTLRYDGGNHKLNVVGVDLVGTDGTVAYSDYHHGTTGGNHNNNVYTLTGVAAGDYTLRYFVTDGGSDNDNIAYNHGTISATGVVEREVTVEPGEPEENVIYDGVYEIKNADVNGTRGYFVYSTEYPTTVQLSGVELGTYGSLHYAYGDEKTNSQWYLCTANDGKRYLVNMAEGHFLAMGTELLHTDGAQTFYNTVLSKTEPSEITIEESTYRAGYYNVKVANSHYLASSCGWGKNANPVRLSLYQNDGGNPVELIAVTDAALSDDFLNAVDAVINPVETPEYEASVTLNPATLPMTDVYAWATVENNVATFTAQVYNDKYEFVGWTSGTETVSTDLVYTVTLTENLELVANFQKKVVAYTASVTMNPATLPMTDVAAWSTVENNVATFTAEVYNDKYEFVGWTNGTETVSTDLVYTVTLTKNLELVANFQEKATEPEAPAYDWAGEYTVNATVADATDNWTTPSPLTMKIFYDEAAAAYKLESFAGIDIKAAAGSQGYYPTVNVSADNDRVATINIYSGIYLVSEYVGSTDVSYSDTKLCTKDGSQTVTLSVDENGVMSIPDMEIVNVLTSNDGNYTQTTTVLSTLTGVTASKGGAVEPEQPVTPAVKWYRIKEVSTSEYMNVFSYDATAEQSAYGLVNVAAYNEEGADQIFTLEAAETEGQYYLRTQNDYYVTTAAWNVNVSNSGKSAIIFEETTVDDLTTYILRDPSKAASGNYFKIGAVDGGAASGNFVYCDAAESAAATWVLEEVVAEEPETPAEPVVLDFTTNDVWGLPLLDNVSFAGQKTVGEYNNGTYTITIDPTANAGQFYFDNNNLRLQKTGSKIVLPAFDFPVAKIEVVGLATSSYASVDMNVYVGDNAVSTACTGSTGTNVYEIAAASQAAGTIYELVIGEAGGAYSSIMNITAINIYPGEEGGDVVEPVIEVAAPVLGDENTKKYFDLFARIPVSATFPDNATETAIYYTTNGGEPTKESLKAESGSSIAVSSHVGTTIKAVAYCVVNGTEYYSEVATATYYEAVTSLYEMSGAVEAGKKYMLVADLWGTGYNAMTPAESTPTKTIAGETVTVNDVFVESLDFFAFTFEAAGTNYKIKDATGMYLGFDGMTASFVLSETGVAEATSMASYDWTVTLNEGVASISVFGRTLAMSGTSWKTVTNVTMTDVLPQLYVAREYPTLNVTPNSKDKQETLKEIVISCATGLDIDEEAGEIVIRDQGTAKQVVVNPGTEDEYTDWVMEYNYFEFTAKMNDEGTAYTITLNEEITVTGYYELVVPAGYFIIEPAGYNKPCEDLYETFNVVANVPFVVDNVTPTNGSAVASLKHIEIDFSDDIDELNEAFDVLDAAGNVVTTAATSYYDADGNYLKDYSMVALELATEITEAGTYTITIPAGKFYATASYEGYDQATGEYIYSKVSDEITLTFTVDPALGIENVEGENGEAVIYDITGRKIEQITAPGIYIVNGKKVLVK